MRVPVKFIGIAAGFFLLFLLLLLPARAGFWLFAPAGVSGFGFAGTVWNGSVQLVRAPNLQLVNTQWDLAALRLPIGQLAGDIETNWNGGFVEGFAAISLGGNITLRNTKATFDATALQPVLNSVPVNGQVSINVKRLKLNDNWPVYVVGEAEVRNLSSTMLGTGADGLLGDFVLSFDSTTETDEDSATGKISDAGGPLEVSGELLLTQPSQYALKVRVKARDEASIAMRRNLEFLGQPEGDGARIFQLAGSI
jgi:general secretion pathway protein N